MTQPKTRARARLEALEAAKGTWGGPRPGAGRKPKAKGTPGGPTAPAEPKAPTSWMTPTVVAQMNALATQLRQRTVEKNEARNPFQPAVHPPGATPPKPLQMAMDSSLDWAQENWNGMGELAGNIFMQIEQEGLLFLGYPYLAQLAQRSEYRVISETIADDATRKWIAFDVTGDEKENADRAKKDPVGEAERQADPDEQKKRLKASGKTDKVKALEDDQERLEVRQNFYDLLRNDGFFGRSHLYMNFGEDLDGSQEELKVSIGDGRDQTSRGKIQKGTFQRLKVIEPVWCYPTTYNAQNPLADNWYRPDVWYVMGKQIHRSRIEPVIGRPVPDMLKPAYSFGGLSLSQMAKPYVDIWLNTRQSVADMVKSFSIMVLLTDLQTQLNPGSAGALMARADFFNAVRDNMGLFLGNKATEDVKNVSAPLSGLDHLQAQAQEHICSVSRIPLVKFTGLSPSGLNATNEQEIIVYDDTISAYQNRVVRPGLVRVVNFEQLSLFGEIDPEITFRFEPLRQLTAKDLIDKQKAEAERDEKFVNLGAISPEEVRKRIIDDKELPYTDLDPEDVPDLLEEEEQGLEPEGGRPDPKAGGEPGKKPGEGGGRSAVLPFAKGASDEAPLSPIAAAAAQLDALGYLQGVQRIECEGDKDQWNAFYDPDRDCITVEGKFDQEVALDKVRTFLHEAGHRGQFKADRATYDEFKKRGLARPEYFVDMANPTHIEDLARTGKVEDMPGEIFAESYARHMVGMDQPAELAAFWDERLASMAQDAEWNEADHPRGQPGNAGQFGPGGGGGSKQGSSPHKGKSGNFVAKGTGNLARQGLAPRKRGSGSDLTQAMQVAWHVAKESGVPQTLTVTHTGIALLKKGEKIPYGHPHVVVDPDGNVAKYEAGVERKSATASSLYQAPTKTADQIIADHGAVEAVRAVKQKLAGGVSTDKLVSEGGFKNPDGTYTPERQKVHEEIIAKLFTPEAIAAALPAEGQKPVVTILGGRGGSGKSWLTGESGPVNPKTSMLINSDSFKAQLPGYEGWNAAFFHEESTDILALADRRATALGINVIHDGTLKTEANVALRLAQYETAGYEVEGYYMYAAPEVAASRALARFSKKGTFTGRFVPPEIILGNVNNEKNFDKLSSGMRKWAIYDNNTSAGPKLVQASYE